MYTLLHTLYCFTIEYQIIVLVAKLLGLMLHSELSLFLREPVFGSRAQPLKPSTPPLMPRSTAHSRPLSDAQLLSASPRGTKLDQVRELPALVANEMKRECYCKHADFVDC